MTIAELRELLDDHRNSPDSVAHEFRLSVGEIVIQALRERGWTQKDLAARIGVTESLISRLLNGDHNWTSKSIGRVMHALDVRIRAQRFNARPLQVQDVALGITDTIHLKYRATDGTSTDYSFEHTDGAEHEKDAITQIGTTTLQTQADGTFG